MQAINQKLTDEIKLIYNRYDLSDDFIQRLNDLTCIVLVGEGSIKDISQLFDISSSDLTSSEKKKFNKKIVNIKTHLSKKEKEFTNLMLEINVLNLKRPRKTPLRGITWEDLERDLLNKVKEHITKIQKLIHQLGDHKP